MSIEHFSSVEECMEISVTRRGIVNVLILKGKLDLANAGRVKETVKALLNEDKTMMHLTMREVDFINSSGLGALVSVMKDIRVHKGRLTLSNLAPYVNEIFEITQLAHVFEIYREEEDAIRSYEPVVTT